MRTRGKRGCVQFHEMFGLKGQCGLEGKGINQAGAGQNDLAVELYLRGQADRMSGQGLPYRIYLLLKSIPEQRR